MGELGGLPVLPGPIWVSGLFLVGLYAIFQIYTSHNKRTERREPTFAELSEENRKLRSELTQQDKRIDDLYTTINDMRKAQEKQGAEISNMRQRQDIMGRILADISVQNPSYRPPISAWEAEMLDDTLPSAWTPNVAVNVNREGVPTNPPDRAT